MKNFKILIPVLILAILVSCNSDDGPSDSISMPIADFSFTSDGSTFTFTNLSTNAMEYQWDFGDLSFYSYEKDPVYTYTTKGGELTVSLTVKSETGEEAFVAKTIIAPIIVIANIEIDGDFEDWAEVPVAVEFPENNLSIKKMKFYTRGPYINIYMEGGTNMELPVIDLFFNVDDDSSTGYNEAWNLGAEFLYEGPPVIPGWGSWYAHVGPGNGFSWAPIATEGFLASGVVTVDAVTNAVEYSIPKALFGTVGDSVGFGMFVGYGAEIYPDRSGDPIIIEIQK
jgi:hypothetical protein